MQYRKLEKIIK